MRTLPARGDPAEPPPTPPPARIEWPVFCANIPGPLAFSVLLHGLLAAALVSVAWISITRTSAPTVQPLPIDAVVIDSQVLHAAQRELVDEQHGKPHGACSR